jgi:hypothetical protein
LPGLSDAVRSLPGFNNASVPISPTRITPILTTLISWGIPSTMVTALATGAWQLLTKLYSKELLVSSGYRAVMKKYVGKV